MAIGVGRYFNKLFEIEKSDQVQYFVGLEKNILSLKIVRFIGHMKEYYKEGEIYSSFKVRNHMGYTIDERR